MKKIRILSPLLLLCSLPALASDWQVTWSRPTTYMVDRESIADGPGSTKKIWTLYAPLVVMGKAGEGYAYNKRLHSINCMARTEAILADVYYDENQGEHDSKVDNKNQREIIPDSREDYLWKYVCKPESQGDLGRSAGPHGIAEFLADQAKSVRANLEFMKRP